MIRYTLSDLLTLGISLITPFTEFVKIEFGNKKQPKEESTMSQIEETNPNLATHEVINEVPTTTTAPIEETKSSVVALESPTINLNTRLVDSSDLPNLTVKQLRTLAKDLEVKIPKHMNKKDIITILKVSSVFPLQLELEK